MEKGADEKVSIHVTASPEEEVDEEKSQWIGLEKADIISGVEAGITGRKIKQKLLKELLWDLEVGLYEMVGLRRLHIADKDGNLVGDRYILGSIIVEKPDS